MTMEARQQEIGKEQAILLVVGFLILLVGVLVGVLRWMVQTPNRIADNAVEIDHLFFFVLFITTTILVLAHIYLAVTVLRFRYRSDGRGAFIGTHTRQWGWVLVPIALILIADIIFDHKSNHIWAKVFWKLPDDAFIVEVTGEQFAWAIRYPGKDKKFGRIIKKLISDENPLGIDKDDPNSKDDIFFPAGQGELHIPVNKPVVFQFRSKDVLHSFFIPFARMKMDCVPGMVTRLWFTPNKVGSFEVACAELCGLGHYRMRGVLVIEPIEKVNRWLDEQPTFSDLML